LIVSDGSLGVGRFAAAVTLAAPVANLVLASGALGAVMIFLQLDVELIGTALFGMYSLGLLSIYIIMRPALRMMGFSRPFQGALLLFGVLFIVFLAAYLT